MLLQLMISMLLLVILLLLDIILLLVFCDQIINYLVSFIEINESVNFSFISCKK